MVNVKLNIKDIADYTDSKIISISGRLDSTNIDSVSEEVLATIDTGVKKIIFDLTQLEYIGSAGLAFLVNCKRMTQRKEGFVCVVGAGKKIIDVFDAAGIVGLLKFYDTVDNAIEKELKK
jgi:anti-anti-sigma factor